jgi:hypothetical protein
MEMFQDWGLQLPPEEAQALAQNMAISRVGRYFGSDLAKGATTYGAGALAGGGLGFMAGGKTGALFGILGGTFLAALSNIFFGNQIDSAFNWLQSTVQKPNAKAILGVTSASVVSKFLSGEGGRGLDQNMAEAMLNNDVLDASVNILQQRDAIDQIQNNADLTSEERKSQLEAAQSQMARSVKQYEEDFAKDKGASAALQFAQNAGNVSQVLASAEGYQKSLQEGLGKGDEYAANVERVRQEGANQLQDILTNMAQYRREQEQAAAQAQEAAQAPQPPATPAPPAPQPPATPEPPPPVPSQDSTDELSGGTQYPPEYLEAYNAGRLQEARQSATPAPAPVPAPTPAPQASVTPPVPNPAGQPPATPWQGTLARGNQAATTLGQMQGRSLLTPNTGNINMPSNAPAGLKGMAGRLKSTVNA